MTFPEANRALTRRRLLQFTAGAALAGSGLFTYTRLIEPRWVDVEEVTLTLPNLAPELAGKRIVQLSDIHISPYFSAERLADAVDVVNDLQPDWIFLTGDFYTGGAQYRADLVEPLRRLAAPAFAIFGNHDVWGGREQLIDTLAETSVTLLVNQGEALAANLWLAGVDDVWSGAPDLKAALDGAPSGATSLLLAHEPDYIDYVAERGAPVAVQFSGHSHGGQVRVPTLGPGPDGIGSRALILPRLGQRYPIGLRQVGGYHVYTNRGLGVWPKPYRFNCRPEITHFTLAGA